LFLDSEPRATIAVGSLQAATVPSLSPTEVDPAHAASSRTEHHTRVKLSDFGLARHIADHLSLALTTPGAIVGTPHYMSPEQCLGKRVDSRSDVYSLGATLFHTLAGRPPFSAPTRDELYAMLCSQPAPALTSLNLAVSEAASRLVARAL